MKKQQQSFSQLNSEPSVSTCCGAGCCGMEIDSVMTGE